MRLPQVQIGAGGMVIHNKTCEDVMSGMDDASVDLVVGDPPYNLGMDDWDIFKSESDFDSYMERWTSEACRVLAFGGSFYMFNTPRNCARILGHLEGCGLALQNWITWDKRDGLGSSSKRYTRGQETILFMTKGDQWTFNADDVRVPYESTSRVKSGVIRAGYRWFPNPKGRLCGEVWHITSERHKQKKNGRTVQMGHMTPKPLEMMIRIVRASSNEGDTVLDPFMGTGALAEVCHRLNRRYIGCDINPDYCRMAGERLKQGLIC